MTSEEVHSARETVRVLQCSEQNSTSASVRGDGVHFFPYSDNSLSAQREFYTGSANLTGSFCGSAYQTLIKAHCAAHPFPLTHGSFSGYIIIIIMEEPGLMHVITALLAGWHVLD